MDRAAGGKRSRGSATFQGPLGKEESTTKLLVTPAGQRTVSFRERRTSKRLGCRSESFIDKVASVFLCTSEWVGVTTWQSKKRLLTIMLWFLFLNLFLLLFIKENELDPINLRIQVKMAPDHNLVEKGPLKTSIFHYQGEVSISHDEKFVSLFHLVMTKSNLELQLHPDT